ncbi:MAG: hybrid sensor histidine kinase/response regulator, partial [Elusimicrobia bacterium]|nr:hybrid sensor histidine kinase/response regulator [Elusimicrobiota bacterium]
GAHLTATASPLLDGEGRTVGAIECVRDITEQKALEGRLAQAQRLEAIGTLAAGIAHDFNNILTAIGGYAGFLRDDMPEGDRRREDAVGILNLAARGARLTRQLMVFSSRQVLAPEVVDLRLLAAGAVELLARLIPESVQQSLLAAPAPCWVKVDAGQFEQVLINLAINASDAMPSGGTLCVETALEEASAQGAPRAPRRLEGPLVRLTVRDDGVGMTSEVKARAFEPFFTTKERGKGTGLGLAMVYGIVAQAGGEIEVESEPGRGTAVHIRLPLAAAPESRAAVPEPAAGAAPRGTESVLLVEDEEAVRGLAARALRQAGYEVLCAGHGAEALEA